MMKRKAVVGIGNTLRGDDGIGVLFLEKMIKDDEFGDCDVELLACDGPISAIIGKLMNCDVLVVVDAVDMGKRAGSIGVFHSADIEEMSMDTHKASLKIFTKLFKGTFYLVGVQPKNIGFNKKVSEECLAAYQQVVETLRKLVNCQ